MLHIYLGIVITKHTTFLRGLNTILLQSQEVLRSIHHAFLQTTNYYSLLDYCT